MMHTVIFFQILGPLADNLGALYGNYNPVILPQYAKTPLQALSTLASKVNYAPGCDDPFCKKYNSTDIKAFASSADVVIVCLGTGELHLEFSWNLRSYCRIVLSRLENQYLCVRYSEIENNVTLTTGYYLSTIIDN